MRNFLLLLGTLGFAGPIARAQTTAAPAAAAAPVPLLAAQRTAALDLLTAMQTEQQLYSSRSRVRGLPPPVVAQLARGSRNGGRGQTPHPTAFSQITSR
ncbi:hypothetical protein [Hymenobacter nivis]|uniref:Uncharacterized protein n=1 Tax=Hymenobacter nivis TaxID=1850093 RepID=A0A2Z3GGT7_9BACT|nr:hypothetical protein [Hymenobacter nivis]AWM33069.1 hypothetical protein DDQ68_09955 [Hymenobacter nivis]